MSSESADSNGATSSGGKKPIDRQAVSDKMYEMTSRSILMALGDAERCTPQWVAQALRFLEQHGVNGSLEPDSVADKVRKSYKDKAPFRLPGAG